MKRTGFQRKIVKPMKRTPLRSISTKKLVDMAFEHRDNAIKSGWNLQDKSKKPKAHNSGWWMKKCDDKMQDINRAVNKRCEVDPNRPCQTGHHFVTKALSSWLRYKFENLIPISFTKHFEHHIQNDPHVMDVVIQKRGREWVEWIEKNRRNPQQTGISYYKEIYAWLESIEEQIKNGNLQEAIKLMKYDGTKRFIAVGDKMA